MHATTYGLDVAKRVFQMYWIEGDTGEIVNRRFGRDDLIQFLSRRSPGRVALEACGSAHWWARKIKALGHEVVLLHAKFIRPFVQTNKTDAADARAIWTSVQQPGMRTVAAKTEDQQAMLSLHRIRSLLVKFRTMQVNQLRGLLYEFGASFRAGRVAGLTEIRSRMAELEAAVPGALMCCLQDQLKRIDGLQTEIDQLDHRIGACQKQDAACRAISDVPGIGRLTATALVATMGDASTFKSGREFAAFLGLVRARAAPEARFVWEASRSEATLTCERCSFTAHAPCCATPRHRRRGRARSRSEDPPTSPRWPSPARWLEQRGRSSRKVRPTGKTM